ncbi:cob(I)yrinic acid a,c-diamide adenosyltransferase [uncultured Ilyobacter sp.]|uniref:cob(I)yrinic acid a,c-diamide adenosyltransferase n=1 Tax=uncultured Ilyobacter sp. TaxID=544433 RepID=UPI0029BFB1F0|nr:cob(I)yrinic acid a,c-diamide adenosyltransferase [uncultured Ilyobacter sp.]
MSISTKKGDKGKTSLWSGERIEKSSNRVEAYGTVDELNSFISEAKHYVKIERVKEIISEIQNDLFKVGGSLASIGAFKYPVTEEDVDRITSYVHEFEREISFNGFVIPGTTIQSAKLDICRTIARRSERRVITLSKAEEIEENVKKYLNRLSDLIYIMARHEEKSEGKLLLKKWD